MEERAGCPAPNSWNPSMARLTISSFSRPNMWIRIRVRRTSRRAMISLDLAHELRDGLGPDDPLRVLDGLEEVVDDPVVAQLPDRRDGRLADIGRSKSGRSWA